MAAGKWSELLGGGIYGIWSPDRQRIYIGSTGKFAERLNTHRPAELLGCVIEIVLSLPGVRRSERHQWEDRAILAMRARGICVVNPTNEEHHRNHMRFTREQYQEHARRGLGKLTPEQRSEYGRKGRQAQGRRPAEWGAKALRKQTTEQHRRNGIKGAMTRWYPISQEV